MVRHHTAATVWALRGSLLGSVADIQSESAFCTLDLPDELRHNPVANAFRWFIDSERDTEIDHGK